MTLSHEFHDIISRDASAYAAEAVLSALADGNACRMNVIPCSATAVLASILAEAMGRSVVIVTESPRVLDEMYRNLRGIAGEGHADSVDGCSDPYLSVYPAWNRLPGSDIAPDPEIAGDRFGCLQDLMNGGTRILATNIQALMQKTLAPAAVSRMVLRLETGTQTDLDSCVQAVEGLGYEFCNEVHGSGEACVRGGLLDVWPVGEEFPVRVDFFGDEIESIRCFDSSTQRSIEQLHSVCLSPVDEWRFLGPGDESGSLFAYLDNDPVFIWHDAGESLGSFDRNAGGNISAHAEMLEEAAADSDACDVIYRFGDVCRALEGIRGASHIFAGTSHDMISSGLLGVGMTGEIPLVDLGMNGLRGSGVSRSGTIEPDVLARDRMALLDRLKRHAEDGMDVNVFFGTSGVMDRFRETHGDSGFDLRKGGLTDGFVSFPMNVAVVSERDIMGYRKEIQGRQEAKRRRHSKHAGETVSDWTTLEPGDLVVHVDHGVGRYKGLFEVDLDGNSLEVLTIQYADNALLHVPVAQVHLLSRYVGVGKHQARLHKLGGRRWGREKEAAESAIRDFAASLLQVQAMRDCMQGNAFEADTPWQHEFEAAFPFEETEDQLTAVQDTKNDMMSGRPMDRLVCGDVGYGKTEVAMRAAFKAVMNNAQVAMLVPTTVLAQQHFDVFADRMAAYPFRIELLSRFRSNAEQVDVVNGLKEGVVDIVIGTHRLVQSDIVFKNLGLLIIDEEQRFGVVHKERLKENNRLVDVLTLTATPIPRTLYMSLTGARDISMIQTAPRERLPVETVIEENTDELVRKAVLTEINRGGQVFYLHNRVMTIDLVRKRLERIVPEARVAVGHGQMRSSDLAAVMRRFSSGAFDVLLCTTIIESGLDMPNVNTIIIDRSDRFGLADLHQLRGRVGRSTRKAYAYMLVPRHGRMVNTARKRLSAIVEHKELGAGFRIALRDLEIRGAGNILGPEQSGHVAAVGFDLYCQLLKRSIAVMKNDSAELKRTRIITVEMNLDFIDLSAGPVLNDNSACIPVSFIDDEALRVQTYRRLACLNSRRELSRFEDELVDRFGKIPDPLRRLLKISLVRILASDAGLQSVRVKNGKVMLLKDGDYVTDGSGFHVLKSSGPSLMLTELARIVKSLGKR